MYKFQIPRMNMTMEKLPYCRQINQDKYITCHQNISLQLAQFQTFFHNILKILSSSCLKKWRNLMNHDNAKND